MNYTDCPVNVPGYFHRGDCDLLCKPPEWYELLFFFLGNYAAHLLTINRRPGESPLATIMTLYLALVAPSAGMARAFHSIFSLAIFAPTELETAARAGALCMVVKDAKPATSQGTSTSEAHGQAISENIPNSIELVDISPMAFHNQQRDPRSNIRRTRSLPDIGRDLEEAPVPEPITMCGCEQGEASTKGPRGIGAIRIHGRCIIPNGYSLKEVPRLAKFENDESRETLSGSYFRPIRRNEIRIVSNYSWLKIAVSLGQLMFAAFTLFKTRGNQIETFGFVAPQLTVVPYAWMSLLNLFGSLICPEYSAMYLIESHDSDELRARHRQHHAQGEGHACFALEGAVGRTVSKLRCVRHPMKFLEWVDVLACTFSIGILILIGLLAEWKIKSGSFEDILAVLWMFFSAAGATMVVYFVDLVENREVAINSDRAKTEMSRFILNVSIFIVLAFCSTGGFILVGKELVEFGVCTEIDSR